MPVNNSTAPITFQELQDFYGGSHPISFSEYFRDGSLVPTNRTVTALNANSASGTSSRNTGMINVVRSSRTVAGAISSTNSNVFSTTTFPVTSSTAAIRIAVLTNDADGGRGSGSVEINGVRYSCGDNTGNGGFCNSGWYFRGPAGSGFTPPPARDGHQNLGTRSAGQNVTITHRGGRYTFVTVYTAAQNTVYDYTLTNNTGQTLNLTSNLGGTTASGNLGNGGQRTASGRSSGSWSWSHPAVSTTTSDANSNIPNSGSSIDMADFRSVTNPVG